MKKRMWLFGIGISAVAIGVGCGMAALFIGCSGWPRIYPELWTTVLVLDGVFAVGFVGGGLLCRFSNIEDDDLRG